MKKKIVALCLCVALAVVAIGGATLAYFTDTDEAKNTFTVGNVEIKLDETNVDDPQGDRVQENSYKLIPGVSYVKDPTITVLKGSEDCYVRMKVTLNNASKIIAMCTDPEFAEDGPTGVEVAFPLIRMITFVENIAAKWDGIIPDNMVDTEEMLANVKYCVYDKEADTITYTFYYNAVVSAADADAALETLFDKIKVPTWVTGEQLASLKDFRIDVTAEAIQAATFADSAAAWAAFDAQK